MNFCSHFPYSLTDLGEIRHRRCPRDVEQLRVWWKWNRTVLMNVNGVLPFCLQLHAMLTEIGWVILGFLKPKITHFVVAVVLYTGAKVNFCPCIERLLNDLGEIRYKLCAHDAVECFCECHENWLREGRTFLLGVNGSTGTPVPWNRIGTSVKYT